MGGRKLPVGGSTGASRMRMDTIMLGMGLGFSSATQFRLEGVPVGLSEGLLLCGLVFWALHLILAGRVSYDRAAMPMLAAGGILILSLVAGWMHGLSLDKWNSISGARDAAAYTFSFLLVLGFTLGRGSAARLESAVKTMMYVSVVGLGSLLSASLFLPSQSILGVVPWVGVRFFGWAENPNQVALAIGSVPFLACYFYAKADTRLARVTALMALVTALAIGWATGSDALIVGWAVAGLLMILAFLAWSSNGLAVSTRGPLRLALPLIILFCLVLALTQGLPEYLEELILYERAQGVRFRLWENGIASYLNSPFFGHGPGAYSWEYDPRLLTEAHNSFIDLATSGGLPALGALVYLMAACLSRAIKARSFELAGCVVFIAVFCMFHFMLRHPIFWSVLLFVLLCTKAPCDLPGRAWRRQAAPGLIESSPRSTARS